MDIKYIYSVVLQLHINKRFSEKHHEEDDTTSQSEVIEELRCKTERNIHVTILAI